MQFSTLVLSVFLSMFVLLIQAAPLHKRASGSATYYNVDVGVTSCGGTYKDTDMIVALNSKQMGNAANPNKNPNCGKKLKVKGPKGSVTVTIVDTCPGCSYGDLDLSPKAFSKIANLDAGRVSITWSGL